MNKKHALKKKEAIKTKRLGGDRPFLRAAPYWPRVQRLILSFSINQTHGIFLPVLMAGVQQKSSRRVLTCRCVHAEFLFAHISLFVSFYLSPHISNLR